MGDSKQNRPKAPKARVHSKSKVLCIYILVGNKNEIFKRIYRFPYPCFSWKSYFSDVCKYGNGKDNNSMVLRVNVHDTPL